MKIVLQGVCGSRAHGLSTPESDYDRVAIHSLDLRRVLGLGGPSAVEATVLRKDFEWMPGQSGDFTSHELGKFLRLAADANPTILELLFLDRYEVLTKSAQRLIDVRQAFLTRKTLYTYGNYARDQMRKLIARGDGSFSADTRKRSEKHARHLARLLLQGREILSTGSLTVRLSPGQARECFAAGRMTPGDLQVYFDERYLELELAAATCGLPTAVDRELVDDVLFDLRMLKWSQA